MIRDNIHKAVANALAKLGAPHVPFVVERPAEMEHGDYATNAALAAAKILKKNPREVAEEIKANILSKKSSGRLSDQSAAVGFQTFSQEHLLNFLDKIEVVGPGFINFTLAGTVVKEIVHEAHEASWGSNELYKGKNGNG